MKTILTFLLLFVGFSGFAQQLNYATYTATGSKAGGGSCNTINALATDDIIEINGTGCGKLFLPFANNGKVYTIINNSSQELEFGIFYTDKDKIFCCLTPSTGELGTHNYGNVLRLYVVNNAFYAM